MPPIPFEGGGDALKIESLTCVSQVKAKNHSVTFVMMRTEQNSAKVKVIGSGDRVNILQFAHTHTTRNNC